LHEWGLPRARSDAKSERLERKADEPAQ
jgi:hypothetical protein